MKLLFPVDGSDIALAALDSLDYFLSGTRVVCNPRGYAKAGVNENPRFDPDFMIEVS